MDTISLDVKTRTGEIKAKDLLRQNFIPMEYYGRGIQNKSFQVDYQTFRRIYQKAGSNTIIDLKVDDAKESFTVLIHEVKYDPLTDKMTHVDLINVSMTEALHTKIPLQFVGVAPAVKDQAGTLVPSITAVEVKCLPKDLVHSIEVDIAPLVDFHSYIRIKDLNIPSTITVLNKPEDVVANVVPPRVEEEQTVAAAGEATAAEGAAPAEGEATAQPAEGAAQAEPEGGKKEGKKE